MDNFREFFLILFCLEILLVVSKCETIPSDIKKCHFGDSDCLTESLNKIIKRFPKGIPSVGMKPIDVVDIKDTEIWNNEPCGGIWFKFKLYNQVNYGFENTTITKIKGFGKDPTSSMMEIHGQIPSLIHKGDYIANGRVWLIEMNSTGESTSDFQQFRFSLKLKVIQEYRNNRRYLKIYELKPIVNMNRWILFLNDFFHENTDLTILVNKVFNENWIEFWNELEPSILNVFKSVFTDMLADVFDTVPYDDMFLKDINETEIN